jgi:hypothetical protein
MAELKQDGTKWWVYINSYWVTVLTSWGQQDLVRQANLRQSRAEADSLCREINTYLEGKTVRVY